MPDAPILPDLSVIGAGKDALVKVRPSAAPHVDRGVWSHLFTGWRAQYGVARQGLAAEVSAARLPLSSGQALTELCQSNYDTARGQASKAIGELTLTRTVIHVRADAGAIPASDATTLGGILTFMQVFYQTFAAHILSVYNTSTGLGSHAAADPTAFFAPISIATMGDLVTIANTWLTQWNRHVQNQTVQLGAPLAAHADPDVDRVLTVPQAFASTPSGIYAAQTLASQQSLLTVVNAIRRAAVVHLGAEARSGTIRAGTRLSVTPDAAAVPPVASSDHTVVADLYVPPGTKTIVPRTSAVLTGTAGDLPATALGVSAQVVVRDPLYDASALFPFAPGSLRSAGGTLGQSDPLLRAASSSAWRGSQGPTVDALLAGVLSSAGAAHFAELDDHATGTAYVYAADEGWAQSAAWLALVADALASSEWSGVGQRVRFGDVVNTVVRVRLDVHLRDAAYLSAVDAISDAIKAELLSYFDDRPDWYVFRASSVGGAAAAADRRRILKVANVVVTDADGVPLPDPTIPAAGNPVTHWRFDDNALDATFLPPG